jgi:hypothetical protein
MITTDKIKIVACKSGDATDAKKPKRSGAPAKRAQTQEDEDDD